MKALLWKSVRFLRDRDGLMALESILFLGLMIVLCLVSMSLASNNLAGEPVFIQP